MKKVIPLLILLGGAISGFSQGTVTFQNSVAFGTIDPTGGAHLVYDVNSPLNPATGVGLTDSTYVAELYAGTSAASLAPLTTSISRFRQSTSSNKGKWAATGINGPNDPLTLPGLNSGDIAFLQVKVWNLASGSSFESAVGGKAGASSVFTYKVPPAGDLLLTDFYMENLQAFALVPEPSAIALGVMGVAGLLLIRRRK